MAVSLSIIIIIVRCIAAILVIIILIIYKKSLGLSKVKVIPFLGYN